VALGPKFGARRAVLLPVSAPFHCALMAPAAREMEEALAAADLRPPTVPLIANITAAPVSDPETIRRQLVQQVTGMVRWRESVLRLKAEGVQRLVEIGAGKVLSGLCKRIDREIEALAVGQPGEVEPILKTLTA
jgi:[acyl-carrier-protein] S-malonyltransferase